MACTTILVGKNASYDGSTMIARNDDSGSGHFTAKKFTVFQPQDYPAVYKSVISGVEIPLPGGGLRMTAVPNAVEGKGLWAASGVNAANVGMTATETITSNPRVLGADPLVKGGIGEEDIVYLVLPYVRTAREGARRLGSLLEQYGTYEMNGIAFQDVDEIWWLETIGGHHWMARRVPDDVYVVMPNQLGLDTLDLDDALGEQKDFMCSADLRDFIKKYHLDLSQDGALNPQPRRRRPRLQHAPCVVYAAVFQSQHLRMGRPRRRLYAALRRSALVHGAREKDHARGRKVRAVEPLSGHAV